MENSLVAPAYPVSILVGFADPAGSLSTWSFQCFVFMNILVTDYKIISGIDCSDVRVCGGRTRADTGFRSGCCEIFKRENYTKKGKKGKFAKSRKN